MPKNKEEILKMNKEELSDYKWSGEFNKIRENKDCSYCSDCSDCSDCFNCSDCSDCSYCSNCYNCSDCFNCSYCSDCYNCSYCSYCSDCSDAIYCRNFKGEFGKYYICNTEVTEEEYKNKKEELGIK